VTIKRIKQAADEVAPTGYYIICWHIIEWHNCQHNPAITCKNKPFLLYSVFPRWNVTLSLRYFDHKSFHRVQVICVLKKKKNSIYETFKLLRAVPYSFLHARQFLYNDMLCYLLIPGSPLCHDGRRLNVSQCGNTNLKTKTFTWVLECTMFMNTSFWETGFEVSSNCSLNVLRIKHILIYLQVNLWKYVEIVQHNMEN
jgi:hypothetical protein